MAVNKNQELKKAHTLSDKAADTITAIAGSMPFLLLNVFGFVFWILLNEGVFGQNLVVDSFPFSFLTTAVSLEAIILSTFVLMSQRRESKLAELRTELDYRTDLQAELEVKAIVGILERLAKKQNVDISDLVAKMETSDRKVLREHPDLSSTDLD